MSWSRSLALPLTLAALACGSTSNDTGSDAAAPADAAAAAVSCSDYCTTIMANCTAGNQQYTDVMNCLNSCKSFPAGMAGDTSGDTLGCRSYHANAAKGDPTTHCPHAGPGGAGVCGSDCAGYCQLAMMYCTAANGAQVYGSLAQCMTVCGATPDDVTYNINVQTGPHVACLLYHAQEASSNPPDHCNGDLTQVDAGMNSVTCM